MTSSPGLIQSPTTLVVLLRQRALRQRSQIACSFLLDGEEETCHLTYEELDERARSIAALLQSLKMEGERALLLYPPGLDYIAAFFGCLYAGVVAVPTRPPRPHQTLERLQAIADDAQAKVVLTIESILSNVERQFTEVPTLKALHWLPTDRIASEQASLWQEPPLSGETLALLQYTSGSTATPKGVILSHRNLLHNLDLIHRCFRTHPESKGMFWLPPYHDMGLIGGILAPLYGGHHVTLMSPYSFLQRPLRWLQAISRTKATVSGGPNFAYELCVSKIRPEQLAGVDLSSWELAFNGAEPVRPETLDRFAAAFQPYGFRREAFYPCYGLAEATLIVTGGSNKLPPIVASFHRDALEQNRVIKVSAEEADARTLVGCGQELSGQQIITADPKTLSTCSDAQVGEIWVAGESVALGYWNRPEETSQIFGAYLADSQEGPFLRTGDLGFLYDGELFVTGRLKDLIVIRGCNYYAQDIELTVERSHPALRPSCGAAFSLEVDDEERLIVVHEVERNYLRNLNAHEVIECICQAITRQHELILYGIALLKTGTIPKTSSGKIMRYACRDSFLDGTLTTIGTWTGQSLKSRIHRALRLDESEKSAPVSSDYPSIELVQNWLISRIAGRLKVVPQSIDIREPLINFGIDSMTALTISHELEEWLGRRLPPNLLWDYPTIESIARHLSTGNNGWASQHVISPEHYKVELFPEYLTLRQLKQAVEVEAGGDPYFKVNDRIKGNTTYVDGRECINFSAYNYLGMSGDPVVCEAAKEAIDLYGTSVSASRVVSGERPLHRELESALAELVGAEDSIVYIGGYMANATTISTLCGPYDLIMYDELSHNSVLQGGVLSRAHSLPFPHNDWQALDDLLRRERGSFRRTLIVIEGVYSMEGDIPDLPRFIEIKKRHHALLMIDEAHSIGVLGKHGRGIGEHYAINPADVDLWMGTLSKSFASCGGYIAASKAVVEYLKYTASGFIYSVGISPPNAAAALAAIRLLESEPERVTRLHERAKLFVQLAQERGISNGTSKDSPVVPLIIGDSFRCIRLSHDLLKRGINVQPMIYPAVEDKAARLRFFINCTHTPEQIRFTLDAVAGEMARLGQNRVGSSRSVASHAAKQV